MEWVLAGLVVLGVVVAAGVWGYNSLVRGRVRLREAWAQIDVQLNRRHDLIPNLVSSVQAVASHERAVFESVTAARQKAIAAQATRDPAQVERAEGALNSSLTSVMAVAEQYPQLQSAANFLALQEELTATEDKIAYARSFYNRSVRDYNIACETLPRSVIASMGNFEPATYFEIDRDARASLPVRLDD